MALQREGEQDGVIWVLSTRPPHICPHFYLLLDPLTTRHTAPAERTLLHTFDTGTDPLTTDRAGGCHKAHSQGGAPHHLSVSIWYHTTTTSIVSSPFFWQIKFSLVKHITFSSSLKVYQYGGTTNHHADSFITVFFGRLVYLEAEQGFTFVLFTRHNAINLYVV